MYITSVPDTAARSCGAAGLRPFTSAQLADSAPNGASARWDAALCAEARRRELCNGNDHAVILTDFHKDVAILVDG